MEKLINLIKDAICKANDCESPFGQKILVSQLGEWMKKLDEGFSCFKYGEKKLLPLLKRHPDLFDIEEDNSHQVPRHFVMLKGGDKVDAVSTPASAPCRSDNPYYPLKDFVYIMPEKFEKLAELAMPENWHGQGYPTWIPDKYKLLATYINYTVGRLIYENKIVKSKDGKYAAFNTGLADVLYRDIYALLSRNNIKDKQEWILESFCVAGENAGKVYVDKISTDPQRAEYFVDRSILIYDTRAGDPEVDFEHMFVEHAERFPLSFFQKLPFSGFTCKDCDSMDKEELKQYKNDLKNSLKTERAAFEFAKTLFDGAVKKAVQRVKWNYKTAIPQYYPTEKSMSLLLPLCLTPGSSRPDVALVVERMASGRYQGHTVLTLEMAYSNARLICRPESDWLTLENIKERQVQG